MTYQEKSIELQSKTVELLIQSISRQDYLAKQIDSYLRSQVARPQDDAGISDDFWKSYIAEVNILADTYRKSFVVDITED